MDGLEMEKKEVERTILREKQVEREKGRLCTKTKRQFIDKRPKKSRIEDRGLSIEEGRMMIMYIEAYLRRVEKTWARSKKKVGIYMYR